MSIFVSVTRRRASSGPLPDPPGVPTTAPYNVPNPGVTPTYDGTGSAVHPGVLDFQQITGAPWHGWRFWMAMTPFHNSNSKVENPSILVSSDGNTWQVPQGLTNPIYPWPGVGWLSDTDLTYDADADQLVMVYRDQDFKPRVARSSNGTTWPAESTVMDWPQLIVGSQEVEAVSPTLVRLGPNQWVMWQIAARSGRGLYRWTASTPEGPWSPQEQCSGGFPTTIWHIHVILHAGVYRAIISTGKEQDPNTIIPASSTNGLAWTWGAPIIVESGSGWDADELYRAAIQPHEDGGRLRVWYCGRNRAAGGQWRIAQTIVPLSEWPAPPTP